MRILGVDLGITSIGWGVIDYDGENSKILGSGVRIFDRAEDPKKGTSLATPRREARSARKVTKRKRIRMQKVKQLFVRYGVTTSEKIETEEIFKKSARDVWQLRDKSLKRALLDEEFIRVLTHIAKHRGYQSSSRSAEVDSDGKKILTSIKNNQQKLKDNGYLTIGQMIYCESKKDKTYRRRNKKGDYSHSIDRESLKEEVITLFEKQRFFHNRFATKDLEKEYLDIAFHQKGLASIEKMVGMCSLEKKEKRAPKHSLSAEEFVTLTEIVNTVLIDDESNERKFTPQEIEKTLQLCKQKSTILYSDIRQAISLEEKFKFKRLDYFDSEIGEFVDPEKSKKTKFPNKMVGFHTLRKLIKKSFGEVYWHNLLNNRDLYNSLVRDLTYEKSDEALEKALKKSCKEFDFQESSEQLIEVLLNLSFSNFVNLSLKAIDKIIPYMLEGKRYDESCKLIGYRYEGKKEKFLRTLNSDESNEITSAVVKRSFSQFRKVLNALIKKYGQFDKIHIELTRDIKRSYKERKKIQKAQEDFLEKKESAKKHFFECFQKEPTSKELLKFRLWKEQDGKCAYSTKALEIEKIIEQGYCEVDHILPFSRSLDDSLNNKVLVLTKENQDKRNRTPFEYYRDNKKNWQEYKGFVYSLKNLKKSKRERLLKENFTPQSEHDFKERNKNDTSFLSRFIKNFVEENLEFRENSSIKQRVYTRNGQLTKLLRYAWGVPEKSRDTHLHHSEDALILAFSTQSEVQKLSTTSAQRREFIYQKTKEKNKKVQFTPPYENFKKDLQDSIDQVFVSFTPRKSVTGAAHKETIYSKKNKSKGVVEINGGVAKNAEVKRVDVFKKDGKFHFIFLYSYDFIQEKLKNTTIKGVEIDESFEFLFSLFKNDLVELKPKKKQRVFGYFKYAEGDGRFMIQPHFSSIPDEKSGRISTGSLEFFKKYQVSLLGEYQEVKAEKRVGTAKQLKKVRRDCGMAKCSNNKTM